jgi:hypothetical protein
MVHGITVKSKYWYLSTNGSMMKWRFVGFVFVLQIRPFFDQQLDALFETANNLTDKNNNLKIVYLVSRIKKMFHSL